MTKAILVLLVASVPWVRRESRETLVRKETKGQLVLQALQVSAA